MDATAMRGFTPLTTLVVFNDKAIDRVEKKTHESVHVAFGNAADMQVVGFLVTREEARRLVEALNTCIERDYNGSEYQTELVITDWHNVVDCDWQDRLCCDLCAHLYPTDQYRKPDSCPNCEAMTRKRAS